MSNNEFADNALNESLNSAEVARAVAFLETYSSSTKALRALVAAMCGEHENMAGAALVEGVLEQFAAIESEQV